MALHSTPAKYGSLVTVGLMSGTSVDGVDAAVVKVQDGKRPELLSYVCTPIPEAVRKLIFTLFRLETGTVDRISQANFILGEIFADAAMEAVREAGLRIDDVDLIGSHGQTIWHNPEAEEIAGMLMTSTLQIGEPAVIAERTGITCVADFRVADMAAGGQGAPLVPFVDFLLLSDSKITRAVQNIGGIGNVTFIPASAKSDDIIAFDTGPGNMLIDAAVRRFTAGKERFDTDGHIASTGAVNEPLLALLMDAPFFNVPPPKSTGRELFGEQYLERLLQTAEAGALSTEDVVATLTAFAAESIADSYRKWLPHMPQQIILGGGGARNPVLIRMIKDRIGCEVLKHEDFGIDGDAKEAMAFAILAAETLRGRPSNVPSATGARHPAILGKIVPGRNWGRLISL